MSSFRKPASDFRGRNHAIPRAVICSISLGSWMENIHTTTEEKRLISWIMSKFSMWIPTEKRSLIRFHCFSDELQLQFTIVMDGAGKPIEMGFYRYESTDEFKLRKNHWCEEGEFFALVKEGKFTPPILKMCELLKPLHEKAINN